MCSEANLAEWASKAINRRELGALGLAGAAAACTPNGAAPSARASAADGAAEVPSGLQEAPVSFPTQDGTMDGIFVHPAKGRHPAVLMWPDIAGPRPAFRRMAERLAKAGYAVFVANPFYRDAPSPIWRDFADFTATDGFDKVKPWRAKLTADAVMRDAAAAIAWLDAQPSVDTQRGVGTQGYCMAGPFAVWTAASVPDRVRAAASFHGGGLVRPGDPQSPDAMLGQSRARFLFAIAQNDDAQSPGDKDALRAAAKAAGRPAEIEVFPANHGWCVPDSPSYDEKQAERAWVQLLALYKSAL